jgi:hypothetical protein
MSISFFSLEARAIKRLFERAIAFLEEDAQSKRSIIARYSTRRWCDSTERALNEELMGRSSCLGARFGARK